MAIIKSSTFIFAAAALLLSSSVVDGASIRGSTSAITNSNNNERFLRHADVDERRNLLFAKKNLRKNRDDKKNNKNHKKSGGPNKSVSATSQSFVVPTPTNPPAPTAAPGPKIEDWVNECIEHANDVESCKGSADPNNNCGMCLKALASVGTSTTNFNGGLNACAANPYCGGCDASDLKPFFECGLVVEGKASIDDVFVDGTTNALPVPTPAVVVPVSPPPPTNPPIDDTEAKTDRINCPAVFPGSGTACVMIGSFQYKSCIYGERGPDASCSCSDVQPLWSCTGVTKFDPIVVEVVEEEDLTVVFVEEDEEITVNEVGEDVIVDVVDVDVVDVDIVDIVDVDIVDADTGSVTTPGLPSVFVDVAVNNIVVESLCPTEKPITGAMCSAGGFDSIECCYEDLVSGVEDATTTCECDNDASNPTFTCYSGAESTCKIL
jgi:hypothetical protein